MLSLETKQSSTIPNMQGAQVEYLRSRLDSKPLGIYRTSNDQFLACFETCAVFVNSFGDMARNYILEWEGHVNHAVLLGHYAIGIGKENIQVWDINERQLKQVITGKDIRLVPCSLAGSELRNERDGVIIAMLNPRVPGKQVVFEMCFRS